jgi:hypothetical protein
MSATRPTTKRGEGIAALRGRVLDLKEQVRLLLERCGRHELSDAEARAEYQRLECELREAEREVEIWRDQNERK